MQTQSKCRLTPEEYLAIERRAEYKSEYYDGEMFALAGASEKHNLITLNIVSTIHAALKEKPCKAYASDMRVRVPVVGLYTYPDIAVVCGKAEFDDAIKDTLLNPVLIIEVLSESTEAYDRGKKFEYYRMIPSLREYVLVAQDRRCVEVFTREDFRWIFTEAGRERDYVELSSIGWTLLLPDVYSKVEFEEQSA